MTKREESRWAHVAHLKPGSRVEFKFVVDGVWRATDQYDFADDGHGSHNNTVYISRPPQFAPAPKPEASGPLLEETEQPQLETAVSDVSAASLHDDACGAYDAVQQEDADDDAVECEDPASDAAELEDEADEKQEDASAAIIDVPGEAALEDVEGDEIEVADGAVHSEDEEYEEAEPDVGNEEVGTFEISNERGELDDEYEDDEDAEGEEELEKSEVEAKADFEDCSDTCTDNGVHPLAAVPPDGAKLEEVKAGPERKQQSCVLM